MLVGNLVLLEIDEVFIGDFSSIGFSVCVSVCA